MTTLEKIVSFAKRRGFIGPSSEMYGGFESSYDYGFLGAELKNNVKKAWWKSMVQLKENIVGLDSAILMSPKIWQASGHLTAGFADPLVECKKCHHRFRKDYLKENKPRTFSEQKELDAKRSSEKVRGKCPDCGGELTEEKKFNLMM